MYLFYLRCFFFKYFSVRIFVVVVVSTCFSSFVLHRLFYLLFSRSNYVLRVCVCFCFRFCFRLCFCAQRQIHAVVSLRGQKKPEKVLFNDVVGCDEAKDEVKQVTQ